jgi:hypothetical protein
MTLPVKNNLTSPLHREWLCHLLPLLLLAAGLHFAALINNYQMPNPDGIAYILQAKAIYYGNLEHLLSAYPWPTNLAPLLAGVYHLTSDWLLAGRLTSIFFSLSVIVPLYFFLRHYCDRLTATALLLLYVTSPVFVRFGNDILRGPEFWFFFSCGLWGMGHILVTPAKRSQPAASGIYIFTSLSLLLSSWSRIEGILVLFLATVVIIAGWHQNGRKNVLAWFIPWLPGILLLKIPGNSHTSSIIHSHSSSLLSILYLNLHDRLIAAGENYIWLQNALRTLQKSPPLGVAPYFFKEARQHLPFLALSVTVKATLQLLGVGFCGLVFYGYLGAKREHPDIATFLGQPTIRFLLLLVFGSLLILYTEILLRWSASPRFAAQIFFPALLLAAPGIRRLLALAPNGCQHKSPARSFKMLLLLAIVLSMISLPSLLHKSRTERSVIFKQIGLELAQTDLIRGQPFKLCGTSRKILYTHFFAYLKSPTIVPPNDYCSITTTSKLDPELMLQQGCRLFLLSDRDGGRHRFLEIIDKHPELQVRILIDKRNAPLHGQVTLYALSRANSSVNVN